MGSGGAISAGGGIAGKVIEADVFADEDMGGISIGGGEVAGDGDAMPRAGELGANCVEVDVTNPACMLSVESSGVRLGRYSSRGGLPVSPSSAASSAL